MKSMWFVILVATALSATDLKIKIETRETSSLISTTFEPEETVYVHSTVERIEFQSYVEPFDFQAGQQPPHMAIITHCDTGVSYQIDLDNHEYRVIKIEKYPSKKEFEQELEEAKKQSDRHIKSTTEDTGETQDFFGHTAKHLKTTITENSEYTHYDKRVDGWYVDMPQPGCAPEYMRWGRLRQNSRTLIPGSSLGLGNAILHVDVDTISVSMPSTMRELPPRFIYTGFVPGGLAIRSKSVVHETLVIQSQKRENDLTIEREVIDFSEEPLDPALFEVPAGFTKVDHLYQHMKTARK